MTPCSPNLLFSIKLSTVKVPCLVLECSWKYYWSFVQTNSTFRNIKPNFLTQASAVNYNTYKNLTIVFEKLFLEHFLLRCQIYFHIWFAFKEGIYGQNIAFIKNGFFVFNFHDLIIFIFRAHLPGVYTNIAMYIDWVAETLY